MGTAITISPRTIREHRVPSLGGYDDHDRHDRNHVITLFLGCLSAVIYGGLHFLSWHYLFQGHTEQMIWRVASIVIAFASVPFLVIFGWVILLHVAPDSWVVKFAVATIAFIYAATRATIIVLKYQAYDRHHLAYTKQYRGPGLFHIFTSFLLLTSRS